MSLSNTVQTNVLKYRRRQKLTQAALAEKAGISVSYVSMLERGRRTPPLETIEQLATALGVPALALLRS